ncbi:ABC-F family ATP-binding cassette domain-containing protein [Desulfotalea psychrophila]|uniref:Related to ABC transporter, ATP-binding protein n=1 Tax=Desulfotalea psychrophila (strain LSv54 / DSM 12343) TaxID=177439 RepID=Q6AK73_DESPS|nr:ABC-F family ATP-binding cassette domain-containing protein [Desulfotalea psychrophila]CAG37253.1 related to ABC transporter, ATP-binding protein [Desulfotalea psychrophila LSv54]
MIHLTNIHKQYGSQVLFRGASLQVLPATRTGLVGANGAGKTSVFRLMMGEEEADKGEISCSKKTVIGYFSQDVGEMSGRSVLDEVMSAAGEIVAMGARMREMEARMGEPMSDDEMAALLEEYGNTVDAFEHRGGYELDSQAKEILTGLRFSNSDLILPVESFSGGWKMRIALAKILLIGPDVLLLDEPTNHLDIESILWLESWLTNEFKGALLMTCHDREFMNRIVSRIIEIGNEGATTYGGDYDFYLKEREIRREQLLASYRRQQEMLSKEEDFIAKFAARVSHAAQVQSRIKKLDKIERIVLPPEQRVMKFDFPVPPRSGDDVLHLKDLGKEWQTAHGEIKPVFSGLTGSIRRLEKIALVGVNGAGKSTLLKVITGQTEATSGEVLTGASLATGYFSQHSMDLLYPGQTVFEAVQETLPLENIGTIRNLLAAFLFQGDDVDKKISSLSGGEKSRVVLAKMLAQPLNFLVLDEPTNHLDIQSREVLLKALKKFEGTLILVSHDRHFLRSLVNRVFEIDHGEMRSYEGDYDYYLREHEKHNI